MNWAVVKPGSEESDLRNSLFRRISAQVKTIYPLAEIFMFGSTSSGLALKGSDIDIVVFCEAKNFHEMCKKIQK